MATLRLRIDFSPNRAVGPGKIRLLELIDQTGSIAAAGREMNMSYRRAWLLVDELNRIFAQRVATTKLGGSAGGGAELTAFGRRLVSSYRSMETAAQQAFIKDLNDLDKALAPEDSV